LADKIALDRVWAFHAGPFVGYFVGRKEVGANVAEYVRADIVEALRADLARAVDALEAVFSDHGKVNSLEWTDRAAAALASIKERDNG